MFLRAGSSVGRAVGEGEIPTQPRGGSNPPLDPLDFQSYSLTTEFRKKSKHTKTGCRSIW